MTEHPAEEIGVQLRVPFTAIIQAVDQLEADELRLLAQPA
jgi:hypothetical protein